MDVCGGYNQDNFEVHKVSETILITNG